MLNIYNGAIGAIMLVLVQLVQLIPADASTTKYYSASKAGMKFIKSFEGLRLQAYEDSSGVITIGYGTTRYLDGSKPKIGDVITKERAEALFAEDVAKCERILNVLVNVELSQDETDALISFIYNVGFQQFKSSTLLTKLNGHQSRDKVALEFTKWVYVSRNGLMIKSVGLIKRRSAEYKIFTGGSKGVPFGRQFNRSHGLYETQDVAKRVSKSGEGVRR